jgi:hypothetical protein
MDKHAGARIGRIRPIALLKLMPHMPRGRRLRRAPLPGGRRAQVKRLDFPQTLARLVFDHRLAVLFER